MVGSRSCQLSVLNTIMLCLVYNSILYQYHIQDRPIFWLLAMNYKSQVDEIPDKYLVSFLCLFCLRCLCLTLCVRPQSVSVSFTLFTCNILCLCWLSVWFSRTVCVFALVSVSVSLSLTRTRVGLYKHPYNFCTCQEARILDLLNTAKGAEKINEGAR